MPLSLLFGDVFRAFNPWRAIGRAVAWVARSAIARGAAGAARLPRAGSAAGRRPPGSSPSPRWSWCVSDGDKPHTLAVAALVYSALTFIGMALYGVERWSERGEAFSVYFNLFSRISPVETRDRVVGLRPPLSGLAKLEPLPGTVALLAVMIGTVSFDGFSGKRTWNSRSPDIAELLPGPGPLAGRTRSS